MFKLLGIVLLALVAGCETVPPAQIQKHVRLQVIPSKPAESKTIFLANVTDQVVNKKMGQAKGGLLCVGGTDLTWRNNPNIIGPMQQALMNELEANGYRVYSGLIQSRGQAEADVLVGAGLKEVRANMCGSVDGFKGEVSVVMAWEVFDVASKKTINLTTSGYASEATFKRTGDPDMYIDAARMAAANLLASPEFHALTRK